MEKDNILLQKLLEKYLEEQAMTAAEIRALQTLVRNEEYTEQFDILLKRAFANTTYREDQGPDPQALFQKIIDQQKPQPKISPKLSPWYTYAAAAVILITFSIGLYLYIDHRSSRSTPISQQWTGIDIEPGGNKAYLTLSDGHRVALREDQTGIQLSTEGVSYLDGTSVSAEIAATARPALLKLNTPVGGQYQVILPDGTRVWLNAASTLSYPSQFTGNERRVVLNGEAYFEVQHTASDTPFIVQTAAQDVEVLGTHFNIQAYSDELSTRTTLLEGSVRVSMLTYSASKILKPNQQSILEAGSNTLQVHTVDPAAAVAWKNGLFYFENATIQTVMREIARWYDLDIEYRGTFTKERFNGKVYRNMTLGQVLDVLSFSKVHFELEGKKLIIYPGSKSVNQ